MFNAFLKKAIENKIKIKRTVNKRVDEKKLLKDIIYRIK